MVRIDSITPARIKYLANYFHELNDQEQDILWIILNASKETSLLALYINCELIGLANHRPFEHNTGITYLEAIFISPQYRRQGYATKLVQYIGLPLVTHPHTYESEQFFKKLQFIPAEALDGDSNTLFKPK